MVEGGKIDHADSAIRMNAHVEAALVVASQLGYESAPFDSERATRSRSKRENGMVESIQSWANATDKPTIVIAGRHHLSVLHRRLEQNAPIGVALTNGSVYKQDRFHEDIPRYSYLLSHDDVHCVRPSNAMQSEPFGFVEFASQLGVDVKGDIAPRSSH